MGQLLSYTDNMPAIRSHNLKYQFVPNFPPTALRCAIKPEVAPNHPSPSLRKPYSTHNTLEYEELDTPSSDYMREFPQCSSNPVLGHLIRKPKGEVSRLRRGGYSLAEALKWESNFYHEVQVR